MSEGEVLAHAVEWLFPRYSPSQIVQAVADSIRWGQSYIGDVHGIEDAAGDLDALVRKWRAAGPRGDKR